MKKTYDIAIVGAGLAGASLALAILRETSYSVLLVEANPPKSNDTRLFGLTIFSERFLDRLGVWSFVQSESAFINEVHVSREHHFGVLRFRACEMDLTHLGHVVPASLLEKKIQECLAQEKSLTFLQPAKVERIQHSNENVELEIVYGETKEIHHANLVVAADGLFSTVRDQLKMDGERLTYNEKAIVSRAFFTTTTNIAEQRLLKQGGTLAVLPLLHHERAVILSVEDREAEQLLKLSDEAYADYLNQHLSLRNGKCERIVSRHAFPLQSFLLNESVSGRVVIFGNAKHLMHPVAAQGFNLALHEVSVLLKALNEHGCTKSALKIFQEESKRMQKISAGWSHWISRVANSDSFLKNVLIQPAFWALMNSRLLRREVLGRLLGL